MKKTFLYLLILALCVGMISGCSYTQEMSKADIARSQAWKDYAIEHEKALAIQAGREIARVDVDEQGRIKSFVVNSQVNSVPNLMAMPNSMTTSGAQVADNIANSDVVKQLGSIALGVWGLKVVVDGAGDKNSNNSGSNNSSGGGDQSIATESATAAVDKSSIDSSSTVDNRDSGNSAVAEDYDYSQQSTSTADSGNTTEDYDYSQTDVGNDKSDNSTDNTNNSQNDVGNEKPIDNTDNSINNQDQYSGSSDNYYSTP